MSQPQLPVLAPGARRALVVEDDKAIRTLAINVLHRVGFVVDGASDGREALRLVGADNPYAVIILDLMMPELNGLEVIDELRVRDPRLLDRIVVITAAVQIAHRGLPAELCRVLLKPFDLAEFQAAVIACADPAPAAPAM